MIWLIAALGLFLRLINLNQSLWLDETINVVYAKAYSLWWFITKYPVGDFHPPGWFAIIWIWGNIFNFSEQVIRFPSVIFGVLTILLTYLIGKKLSSKKIGLMAALFLSLAPLHIYYSQEARMYSFAAFTVALSSYFFLKLIRNEKFAFIEYTLSVTLVLYSDYLAYFSLLSHGVFTIIYHRRLFKRFILSLFLGTLPFLFWLPILTDQLHSGIRTSNILVGWRSVVGGTGFKEVILLPIKIFVGKVTFENKLLYALLITIISIPYIIAFKKFLNNSKDQTVYTLLWILTPIISALLFSFFIPVFAYFRLLFILPAFYLLIALGIGRYNFRFRILLILLISFYEILMSGMYLLNPRFHREDWREAVEFINQNSDAKTITLQKNNEILAPVQYYQSALTHSLPAFKKIPVNSNADLNDLEKNLAPYNKIFIINYLVDITDPQRILEKEITRLGFSKQKVYDFRAVGFIYEFEK